MFKLKYITPVLLAAALASCDKRDNLDAPSFDVKVEKTEFKKGDSVVFTFSGQPDVITFFSGEKGSQYEFRTRTQMNGGVPELSFSSRVLFGTQEDILMVKASTDFSGTYTAAEIQKATWTDITNRFTLATVAPGGNSNETPSGISQVSDLLVKDKPIYFAFRYWGDAPANVGAKKQRTWRIMSFNLNARFPDGFVGSVANLASGGWVSVDIENPGNKWTISPTLLDFAPNSSTVVSEDWVISKPIVVSDVVSVTPDQGIGIKEFSDRKTAYGYVFKNAGTYTVTFIGANTNATDVKQTIKQIQLTVTE